MQSLAAELPIFRSPGQAALLAALLLPGGVEWRSLSDLARRVGLAPSSVQREVERLSRAGIVETERVGNVRRVRANRESRFYPELSGLLLKAAGPVPVVGAAIREIPGVEGAYIFGSWARHLRRPETMVEPARDLDLLVVGEPDLGSLYEACATAGGILGLEVAPTVVSSGEWASTEADDASPFLRAVHEGDLVVLSMSPGE